MPKNTTSEAPRPAPTQLSANAAAVPDAVTRGFAPLHKARMAAVTCSASGVAAANATLAAAAERRTSFSAADAAALTLLSVTECTWRAWTVPSSATATAVTRASSSSIPISISENPVVAEPREPRFFIVPSHCSTAACVQRAAPPSGRRSGRRGTTADRSARAARAGHVRRAR